MDWKAIGNIVAFVGLLVAMVVMFNQVNTRIDRLQVETNARIDRLQAETNARFDKMFDRQDRMQAETNAQFDDVLEAIMSFDRRVSHLEGRLDAQNAE